MDRRLQLQARLQALLPQDKKAWFQPPATVKLTYPTIIYKHDDTDVKHANNVPYIVERRWQVTVIDENPDSPIVSAMEWWPKCTVSRKFEAENLNHTVFDLYF